MSKWKPGQSGNPDGRKPGSGQVAQLRASIAEQVPGILARLSDAALSGDVGAARLLLERAIPPLKAAELPVEVSISGDSLTEQASRVLASAADGDLAPGQAAVLIGALANVAKIAETDELLRRIERLEAAASGSKR